MYMQKVSLEFFLSVASQNTFSFGKKNSFTHRNNDFLSHGSVERRLIKLYLKIL